MPRLIALACLCLCFTSASSRATYVFFTVEGAPKEGVDQLVYHTTVLNGQSAKGYYWADQANFVHGGHAMYIGLQPRERAEDFRAIFSVFGKGPRGISDHTSNGADGGAGASGSIAYPWVMGHRYALEMKVIKSDKAHDDEEAWQGSVMDEATHRTTVIAAYAVPKAWGHLSPKSVFFDEYFPYNAAKYHGDHPAPRPEQPYAKVLVEAPAAAAYGKPLTAVISGLKPNNPDNENLQKTSDTAATVETGLSARSKAGPRCEGAGRVETDRGRLKHLPSTTVSFARTGRQSLASSRPAAWLFAIGSRLAQFQRQAVGIGEEREPLAGQAVDPDRFDGHAGIGQRGDGYRQIDDPERQVPQAHRLRIVRPGRRGGEREQLDLAAVRQRQVQLVRVALPPVRLGHHGQAEHVDVEPFRPCVVGADDRRVVDGRELQHDDLIGSWAGR